MDVILVNGCLHQGDTMVLCTQDGAIVTQARSLLTPPPSRETRVKSDLIKHEALEGAIGLKITGDSELTKVIPGTSIMVMHADDDVEDVKEEVMKDVSGLVDTLATEAKGVTVQASTLGALEALLEFLRNPGKDRQGKERPPIPVFSATLSSRLSSATSPAWRSILASARPIASSQACEPLRIFAGGNALRRRTFPDPTRSCVSTWPSRIRLQ